MTRPAAVAYEKLKRIRVIFLDVDGILSDGRIILSADSAGGLSDTKAFHAHDGHGLIIARQMGYEIGIATSRKSALVSRRAEELGIRTVFQDAQDKLAVVKKFLNSRRYKLAELLYIGDDLIDLPLLEAAGFSVTVPEAPREVRQRVDYVTDLSGGHGAVRETLEMLFKIQGKWDRWVAKYTKYLPLRTCP